MKTAEREEAIRLRVESRLSLAQIAERLGVAKSSVSRWLKDFRLTDKEVEERLVAAGKAKLQWRPPEPSRVLQLTGGKRLSRLQRAKISEAAVLFRLCLRGFSVYGSPFDGDLQDWIVVRQDGKVLKIQVKSVSEEKSGRPLVKLLHREGGRASRYGSEAFDFIIGYYLRNDTAYVFSRSDVSKHKACISIRDDVAEAWHKLED